MKKTIKGIKLTKIESTKAIEKAISCDDAVCIDDIIEKEETAALAQQFPWPAEITETLEAVRKNAYVVLNKHNNKPEVMRVGVWLHRSGKEAKKPWDEWYVCAMPKDGSMCCLNPIYVNKDGVPCLSMGSVGDNVYAGYGNPKFYPERDFQTGMAAYNWRYMKTEEKHGFPEEFLGIPMYDNRIVYAEGRHEKFIWNEDTEEVQKFRF